MKVRTPRKKYLRLLKLVVEIGLFSAVCGFVFLYFWDYGLSTSHLSAQEIVARATYALKRGMWSAVLTGFPMWLALEKFRKPRIRRTDIAPAVRSHADA